MLLSMAGLGSICNQLPAFTSTSMGFSAAQTAAISFGRYPSESKNLLNPMSAAAAAAISSQTPPMCKSSRWLPVFVAIMEGQLQREEERDREREEVQKVAEGAGGGGTLWI
ncbi:hypothetical protein TIFTF001_036466 [Ficus carica]|uniref:Uncharacterized protein n=1 Tax=Ficus carica TaxID=3494 RepID=A0AA88E5A7_FICCA|nr:hypothetical protein TIFTF001_036455 [Ficus carica]GMN67400.1 hypothetical protein TIFTF001_036458 [Ficus carica]GMN67401.1 hypothetical protein TIFTF001_036463 [Ficus carica]GMN67408.1 hypothetical protein TIFTF001_036466 [Ficus carica]